MDITDLAEQADRIIETGGETGRPLLTALPGLMLLRHAAPTTFEAVIYNPVICLILQGRKETTLGDRAVSFGRGESLVVSHDLPVTSRVTQASPEAPYLAMIQTVDLGVIRSLNDQLGDAVRATGEAKSLDVSTTDATLIDALGRYLALADRPVEAKVMAPLVLREIHFRALLAPHGAMLRNLLWRDSHASRISRAIARIRQEFRSTLVVADLAEIAGMSPSSFHEHFKSITATTPLQYHKDLRLMEARRLLSEGGDSVSAAAFEVGYESPTQFSREYARKFGAPPCSDVGRALIAV